MQVQAVNFYSGTNFTSRKDNNKVNNRTPDYTNTPKQSPLNKLSGPAIAAMFLVPGLAGTMSSCEDYVRVYVDTHITFPIEIPIVNPKDTIYITDKDTIMQNDTIILNDTIYIPTKEFEFPYEIQDSLNEWREDVLDIEGEGDDDSGKSKALLYVSGTRDWYFQQPEYFKLNLEKSDNNEARYEHVVGSDIKNDVRVTKINPGEITIVKKDGSELTDVGGLMFNEDGEKTFAHSSQGNKIVVYPKAMSGEHRGKYVELGTLEPGYLNKQQYGQNVLLNGILSEGTEDHFTNIKSKAVDAEILEEMSQEKNYSLR